MQSFRTCRRRWNVRKLLHVCPLIEPADIKGSLSEMIVGSEETKSPTCTAMSKREAFCSAQLPLIQGTADLFRHRPGSIPPARAIQPGAQTSLRGQPFEVFCMKAVSQRHASTHISSRVLLAFQPKKRSAFAGSAQHFATSPGRRSAMR